MCLLCERHRYRLACSLIIYWSADWLKEAWTTRTLPEAMRARCKPPWDHRRSRRKRRGHSCRWDIQHDIVPGTYVLGLYIYVAVCILAMGLYFIWSSGSMRFQDSILHGYVKLTSLIPHTLASSRFVTWIWLFWLCGRISSIQHCGLLCVFKPLTAMVTRHIYVKTCVWNSLLHLLLVQRLQCQAQTCSIKIQTTTDFW